MSKVLFITVGLDVGGLEIYLNRFLAFAHAKLDTHVLCKGQHKHWQLEDEIVSRGTKVSKIKIGYFSIQSWISLYRFLRNNKFDAICDFTGDFAGIPLLVARMAGIQNRVVFYRESKHQFAKSKFKSLYATWSRKLVFSQATSILSNSKSAFDQFYPNKKSSKFQVIYNGVPNVALVNKIQARVLLGLPEDGFIIGHVGRYAPAKNHALIFKIADACVDTEPNAMFAFCGKGVDTFFSDTNPVPINIKLLGVCQDIPLFLSALDVFIFPSINEGQPNALIEAIIHGVNVVASDIDPVKEVFPSSEYQRLIDPNDISAFKKALFEPANPALLQELAQGAQASFNEENRFNEFLDVLVGSTKNKTD